MHVLANRSSLSLTIYLHSTRHLHVLLIDAIPALEIRPVTRSDLHSRMTFHLTTAQPENAPRIAQLHIDAFSSNALIRAIYAADTNLTGLRKAVELKAVADMQDEKTTVLVARCNKTISEDSIIGFAKWTHPIHSHEKYTPPKWNLPQSTDHDILGRWKKEVEKVESKIIGDEPHYGLLMASTDMKLCLTKIELTYIAVDAAYARQGVGVMMVQWALDRCEAEGYPTYVESTVDAVGFYEKMGFEVAGRIRLDLVEVGEKGNGRGEVYEEVGCVCRPGMKDC
jgi:GNAT superfamily N-acetyltransferase